MTRLSTAGAIIFKICRGSEWADAERSGAFDGSGIDLRDGYIHFSTAQQVVATAAMHFAGIDGLKLVAVDADALGPALQVGAGARRFACSPTSTARLPSPTCSGCSRCRSTPRAGTSFPT